MIFPGHLATGKFGMGLLSIDRDFGLPDRLLNKSYAGLMVRLDKDGKARLRESQRAWMTWRDLEIGARRAIYGNFRGTMYVPMGAYAEMNVTRERAMYLERMLKFMEEES